MKNLELKGLAKPDDKNRLMRDALIFTFSFQYFVLVIFVVCALWGIAGENPFTLLIQRPILGVLYVNMSSLGVPSLIIFVIMYIFLKITRHFSNTNSKK